MPILGIAQINPEPEPNVIDLVVQINGLQTNRGGKLLISLIQGEENWFEPGQEYARIVEAVTQHAGTRFSFKNLPVEKSFAVSVLHDENENSKVDFQWLPPRPKEGVGTSNNVVRMGPPLYKDAQFLLTESPTMVIINLSY